MKHNNSNGKPYSSFSKKNNLQKTTGELSDLYMNSDGTLKDDIILADIHKAAIMYENGELVETKDLLLSIAFAIGNFSGE